MRNVEQLRYIQQQKQHETFGKMATPSFNPPLEQKYC